MNGDEGFADESPGAKRPRLSSPHEGEMCVKVLVSSNTAGKIIGRGGTEIKALRDQLGVGLHIHAGHEHQFPKAPGMQIAVLFGSRENIDAAFTTIIDKMLEADQTQGDQTRVTLLVTKNATGMIIGTKGATITELRKESGCNISADTDIFAGEQLVHVTGHVDRLAVALALLTPLVEKSGDSLGVAEQKYGGGKGMYGDSGKGGKGMYGDVGKGKGKGKGKIEHDWGKGHHKGWDKGWEMQPVHVQPQAFVAPAMDEERAVMESQSVISFSIPKEAIGRVLGKAGSSSAEIRRLTGSHLKIEPREEDGMVTLTGQLHQVHKAHVMVVHRVLSPY